MSTKSDATEFAPAEPTKKSVKYCAGKTYTTVYTSEHELPKKTRDDALEQVRRAQEMVEKANLMKKKFHGVPNFQTHKVYTNITNESSTGMTQEMYDETMEQVNKAQAYWSDPNVMQQFHQGTARPAQNPPVRKTNQFNIFGGTIGQAAIGNQGKVVFNQDKQVFEDGSMHSDFDISGGNFAQANLAGRATYNNAGSKVTANSSGGGDSGAGVGGEFSPEELTLHILECGVTSEQFINLLEHKHSLTQIACCLPKDPMLRRNMINALLAD